MQACGKFGAVAGGHEETVEAAGNILKAGGNAFDAAVAAMATACVAEPVLASLGGGGFLLARTAELPDKAVLYDFFTQTPGKQRAIEETEFMPVLADFGTATQEFHIGAGACATPGMVAGLSAIQRDLCRMPPVEHYGQAIELARQGFDATGSDISPSAVAKAAKRAEAEGVIVRFVHDDVLDSKLKGPFDLIMDRGCFHVIDPATLPAYLETVTRLLSHGGYLLLKTFHKQETRAEGPPNRFEAADIKKIFSDHFELLFHRDSCFESTLDANPKALFCILKKE